MPTTTSAASLLGSVGTIDHWRVCLGDNKLAILFPLALPMSRSSKLRVHIVLEALTWASDLQAMRLLLCERRQTISQRTQFLHAFTSKAEATCDSLDIHCVS